MVLIVKVQRLKGIFSVVYMNVHAYLNILNPGQMMYMQNDATQDNVSWGFTVYKNVTSCQRTVENFER